MSTATKAKAKGKREATPKPATKPKPYLGPERDPAWKILDLAGPIKSALARLEAASLCLDAKEGDGDLPNQEMIAVNIMVDAALADVEEVRERLVTALDAYKAIEPFLDKARAVKEVQATK